jgi:hypothetical protein
MTLEESGLPPALIQRRHRNAAKLVGSLKCDMSSTVDPRVLTWLIPHAFTLASRPFALPSRVRYIGAWERKRANGVTTPVKW